MSAVEVQISDAIVAELNDAARPWAGGFTAELDWFPFYEEDDEALVNYKVGVLPSELDETTGAIGAKIARAKDQQDYTCAVVIQKRVTFTNGRPSNTEMRANCQLAQDVHDWFRGTSAPIPHRLANLPSGLVIEAKRNVIYFLAMLQVQHLFQTFIDVKVRIYR